MVEEFLAGEEAIVTVVSPTQGGDAKCWALPVVTRINHQDRVAPYNGVVAVTTNSRAEYGRIWQTWLRRSGQPDSYRCPGSRLDYSGLLVRILETALPLSALRAEQPSKRLVQD